MNSKKLFMYGVGIYLILAFICPLAGQMKAMKFRGINIPYTLKHNDTVIEKGKYDIEISMPETSGVRIFYLRILKKNKALCILDSTIMHYDTEATSQLRNDPNIPDKPRLTMGRNPVSKKLYIYFESGKHSPDYPFTKLRFVIDYIE